MTLKFWCFKFEGSVGNAIGSTTAARDLYCALRRAVMNPLAFMIYFVTLPVFLAGLYTAWVVWREEHKRTPPAE
jgi:hypothetical protein